MNHLVECLSNLNARLGALEDLQVILTERKREKNAQTGNYTYEKYKPQSKVVPQEPPPLDRVPIPRPLPQPVTIPKPTQGGQAPTSLKPATSTLPQPTTPIPQVTYQNESGLPPPNYGSLGETSQEDRWKYLVDSGFNIEWLGMDKYPTEFYEWIKKHPSNTIYFNTYMKNSTPVRTHEAETWTETTPVEDQLRRLTFSPYDDH